MIAIDTNVLLRYLLDDDEAQSRKSALLINGSEKVLITDVVLAETTWTLKGKRYGLDKELISGVIYSLFEEPNIVFESGATVWRAVNDYNNTKPIKSAGKKKDADFSDALIVNKARYIAETLNKSFRGVDTFDVAAQQIPDTNKP